MFLSKLFELGHFNNFFYPKYLLETALYYTPIDFLMNWVDLGIYLR